MGQFVISTDMGGTFVDAAILDLESGRMMLGKASSTPQNPPDGIVAAIGAAAEIGGVSLAEVIGEATLFLNGTTVTTNAMIERKGARTGLLITAGFEDTIAIAGVAGRTAGLDEMQLLDYRHAAPPLAMVPPNHIRGVVERVDAHGETLIPLDVAATERAIGELVAEGVEALAICFLWSFRNPANEQAAKDIATRLYPDLFVVASSDLAPVLGEFARANTTVINAFLGPVFESYTLGLGQRIREENFRSAPLIMQSIGGLAPAEQIQRTPISTLFSGPVGGVVGSLKLGEAIGEANLITTDMGGTSFDVGLVLNGRPLTTQMTVIERQAVAFPTVEVVTVGAGGGSAAWINNFGILQVGPQSMGSMPGPACYLRGGTMPTVTDADVVLGYIDPDQFLGGRMRISREAAETAIRTVIAEPLGMEVPEAAAAIYDIANAHMADLIRRVSVERGFDPRDFAMVAFGGCGPTHCTAYGPDVGVPRLVVPPAATVFSAFGIGQADLKHARVRSFPAPLRSANRETALGELDRLNATLAELARDVMSETEGDSRALGSPVLILGAEIRYQGQTHQLQITLPDRLPLTADDLAESVLRFERAYEQRYGAGANSPRTALDWVSVRAEAAVLRKVQQAADPDRPTGGSARDALLGIKPIFRKRTGGYADTPLYAAERLPMGATVEGPALVVSYGMTIPLHDGQSVAVDRYGNFLITFAG